MIRVTGGIYKGRNIHCPQGKAVRPTTAFLRESLFSILGPRLIDAQFLDLFAGCGIVGIEAISRGAQSVTAVDNNGSHCRMMQANADLFGLTSSTFAVQCRDVFLTVSNPSPRPFDIVYLDPPYDLDGIESVVSACFSQGWLSSEGVLVWESRYQKEAPDIPHAVCDDTRRYGTSRLSFFRHSD